MKFLYWNINRKPIQHLVAALAYEHELDVIILSECEFSLPEFLITMNTPIVRKYGFPVSPVPDPIIITRLPGKSFRLIRDQPGISIRRLMPPIGPDMLIFVVHLSSKLYQDRDEQTLYCPRLSRDIEIEEQKIGHRRTLLVGDFNMNPFDPGVVGADGLHAMMARNITEKRSRIVMGEERFFFYNPMWNHFGDFPSPPPGTYFYDSGTQINYYWNMFDQVMIRAELLEYFRDESLHLLTSAGATKLLNVSGRPDKQVASDHLPIMFELNLLKGV
jgi:hypothetical protein